MPSGGLINEEYYTPPGAPPGDPKNQQQWSLELSMKRMRELHQAGDLDYNVGNFTTGNSPEGLTYKIGKVNGNNPLKPDLSNCESGCRAPNDSEEYSLITSFPLSNVRPTRILNLDDTFTTPPSLPTLYAYKERQIKPSIPGGPEIRRHNVANVEYCMSKMRELHSSFGQAVDDYTNLNYNFANFSPGLCEIGKNVKGRDGNPLKADLSNCENQCRSTNPNEYVITTSPPYESGLELSHALFPNDRLPITRDQYNNRMGIVEPFNNCKNKSLTSNLDDNELLNILYLSLCLVVVILVFFVITRFL